MMKGTVGMLSALFLLCATAPSSRAFIDDFDNGNLVAGRCSQEIGRSKAGNLSIRAGVEFVGLLCITKMA